MRNDIERNRRLIDAFLRITSIPRCSGSEGALRKELIADANALDLAWKQDEAGNLAIFIPPTPGMERAPGILLQAHMDMVCVADPNNPHDFMNDPIRVIEKDEWLSAAGTSLGADNGVGCAMALCIAPEKDFKHGPLELLFTAEEETGMHGVQRLSPNLIAANMKFAINLDFEAEDYICIGGAGGLVINSEARLKTESHAPGEPFSIWKLQARGVQGGHSGNDIDARPQNLHQHLFSIIKQLNACLLEYQGGEAINSIPSHADLILAFPRSEDERARDALARYADSFSALYAHAGGLPALEFEPLTESDSEKQFECLARPMTSLLADAVSSLPNGVISRHARLGGNPCTSSSIGTVQLSPGGHLQVGIVVRSDNESEMTTIGNSIFETLGKIPAVSFKTDKYPAWQPDENAPIVRHCQRQRKNLFSKEATLISVHAGLECGLLAAKYPRLQFVSIGPNIEDVHSTRERVSIESMHRVYAWLKAIISDIGDIH